MSNKIRGPRLALRLADREERHCTSGCLLAVILLLPYCADSLGPAIVFSLLFLYIIILVPVLMKYIPPMTIVNAILLMIQIIWMWSITIFYTALRVLNKYQSDKMASWQVLSSQVAVFMMSEIYNCTTSPPLWPVLLLCYIFLAFISHYKQCYHELKNTIPTIHYTILIFVQILVVMFCCFYSLLLENYSEDWQKNCFHVLYTFVYFVITDRSMISFVGTYFTQFQIESLERLEGYYWAFVCRFIALFFPVVYMFRLFKANRLLISLFVLYITIYVPCQAWLKAYQRLQDKLDVLKQFPKSNKEELQQLEDVCAICLQPMTHARVLPCRHFFHGHCIRDAIKERLFCPLCKHSLSKR